MKNNHYIDSLTGTPQGGIISPLLFNIYMFPLDKFIFKNFIEKYLNHKTNPPNKKYEKIRMKYRNVRKELKLLEKNSTEYNMKKHQLSILKNTQMKTPSMDVHNLNKSSIYARQADDWVLLITGTQKEAENVKTQTSDFIEKHLQIKLDKEKTLITKLIHGVHFLGFELIMWKPHQLKISTVLQYYKKDGVKKFKRVKRRTTSRKLSILPSIDRLRKNLVSKGFFRVDKQQGKFKGSQIVLDEYEIGLKSRRIIIGLYNYYAKCDNLNKLNFAIYILTYSCAHTLATRRKESIKKTFARYGPKLQIKRQFKKQDESILKSVQFETLKTLKQKTFSFKDKDIYDPFHIQRHWRTKFKFYQDCCICGYDKHIDLHHLNSLASIPLRKRDKYEYIRSQLNRIQIPVCKKCHLLITNGKYDKKSPIEFYNEYVAKL